MIVAEGRGGGKGPFTGRGSQPGCFSAGRAQCRRRPHRLDEAPERGVVVACHFAGERAEANGRGGEGARGRSGFCRSGLWPSEIGKVRGEGIVDIGYWGDCSRGAGWAQKARSRAAVS